MKPHVIIAAASLSLAGAVPAFAQQTQPTSFAPFEVTQRDYAALSQFLAEQPYKAAAPIVAYLDGKERQAQAAAMAARAAKAKADKKKPAPEHKNVAPSSGK